ncbi:recombinase family protein [Nocardia sp. NPDC005998]|uniref:recombinase family protein n=1 Tax=Nocardia sp. NPDC005998 TaxID=3156894 RepID=UPI00339F71EE
MSADRAGDQVVVTKLDRLGRSLEHLIELCPATVRRSHSRVHLSRPQKRRSSGLFRGVDAIRRARIHENTFP